MPLVLLFAMPRYSGHIFPIRVRGGAPEVRHPAGKGSRMSISLWAAKSTVTRSGGASWKGRAIPPNSLPECGEVDEIPLEVKRLAEGELPLVPPVLAHAYGLELLEEGAGDFG